MHGPDTVYTFKESLAVSAQVLLPFRSTRRFNVTRYTASHGLLLWRGMRTNSEDTRHDILFQDVMVMELRVVTDGFHITEVGIDQFANQPSRPLGWVEDGRRAFAVGGSGWNGFILADHISMVEYSAGNYGHSPLLGPEDEDIRW